MTDLSGTYDVVANSPMGDQNMTLTIKADGGSFAGDKITWQQAITVPMPLTLECEATITGDELSGKVDTGAFGNFPLTGRRVV